MFLTLGCFWAQRDSFVHLPISYPLCCVAFFTTPFATAMCAGALKYHIHIPCFLLAWMLRRMSGMRDVLEICNVCACWISREDMDIAQCLYHISAWSLGCWLDFYVHLLEDMRERQRQRQTSRATFFFFIVSILELSYREYTN